MLYLLDFINSNPDWEEKISKKPYCVTVKRKENFIMFNYSQVDSDFFNPVVKECRGIILDDNFHPVCVPFYKFGNYGESYVDTIDWDSARVQEKVDGSLIKVWNYDGKWHISTNGMIDAHDATIQSDASPFKTFYDLFLEAAKNSGLQIHNLDTHYTWMFEMISPWNRVVVPYTETEVRHIGTRDIRTLKECDIDIGVKKPISYGFKSLHECIEAAKELPFSEEGYVVVDKYWHRNKIKSPAYVAAHHLKNNGIVTYPRVVEMIRQNENEEFLTYYPEFNNVFNRVRVAISNFCREMDGAIKPVDKSKSIMNRRDFANYAKTFSCPAFMFSWLDGKVNTASEWLWKQNNDKIVQWIGV